MSCVPEMGLQIPLQGPFAQVYAVSLEFAADTSLFPGLVFLSLQEFEMAHVGMNSQVGLRVVPTDLLRPYFQVTNLQFYCLGSLTGSTVAVVAALTAGVGVMVRGGLGGGTAAMVVCLGAFGILGFCSLVDLN